MAYAISAGFKSATTTGFMIAILIWTEINFEKKLCRLPKFQLLLTKYYMCLVEPTFLQKDPSKMLQ